MIRLIAQLGREVNKQGFGAPTNIQLRLACRQNGWGEIVDDCLLDSDTEAKCLYLGITLYQDVLITPD